MRFHSLINISFVNDFHQKCSATIFKILFNVFTTFAVVQSQETSCIHNVFMPKVTTNRSCSHSQLDWQSLVVICSHSQSLVAWLACLFITDPIFAFHHIQFTKHFELESKQLYGNRCRSVRSNELRKINRECAENESQI